MSVLSGARPMYSGYWTGLALGLGFCLVLGLGIQHWITVPSPPAAAEALAFNPPLVSQLSPWLLPSQSREFTVRLHNLAAEDAVIEELRFSCPCVTGRVGETGRLPYRLAAGESVPIHATVTSKKGERGRVEIRYGVIAHIGETRVAPGALAEFQFAQVLNADPPLLTFGGFRRDEPPKAAMVSIWSPEQLVPSAGLSASCTDPAISVELTSARPHTGASAASASPASNASVGSSENMRIPLRTLTIRLDPHIAPEKLKTDVVVQAGEAEVRIPVLGLLDETRSEESDE